VRTPFGERLYSARQAAGLTQAQVAAKLGMSQASYTDWERYPVALRPDQIERIIEILGITPNFLFGRTKTLPKKRKSPLKK
jgi:transcriptional regulator with XRE-family HTH domain